MARTSPAPNIPPIPGMCPGVAVAGGGGGGGGAGGKGSKKGKGKKGAGKKKGKKNAKGGKKGAKSKKDKCGKGGKKKAKCSKCGSSPTAGEPIDIATGSVVVPSEVDVQLPGPINLEWQRSYDSLQTDMDTGLGFGWSWTFGWKCEWDGSELIVRNGAGETSVFDAPAVGQTSTSEDGWVLERTEKGVTVWCRDDFLNVFRPLPSDPERLVLAFVCGPGDNDITLDYDHRGHLRSVVDSSGRLLRIATTSEGRISSVEVPDPYGNTIVFARYLYDDRGDLRTFVNADGATYRYVYDEQHRLTTLVYPSGLTFFYTYDSEGRCCETWGVYPDGSQDPALATDAPQVLADGTTPARGIYHVKVTYHDDFREVISATDVQRYITTDDGTISKAVGNGAVTVRTYNELNQEVERSDGNGATTVYEYDGNGELIAETDAVGNTVRLVRDDDGALVEMVDPEGGVVRVSRDRRGFIESITDQRGGVTTFVWDSKGLMVEEGHPNGSRSTFRTDQHGNVSEAHLPNGSCWRFRHDWWGRLVERIDPCGRPTLFQWSPAGNLTGFCERDGSWTMVRRDAMGNPTEVVLPDGAVVQRRWGGIHWMFEEVSPGGSVVRGGYDHDGQLIRLTNGRGESMRLHWNLQGVPHTLDTFGGRPEYRSSDAEGNLTREDTGAGITELVYDPAGRLVSSAFPDGTSETLVWDRRSELREAHNASCGVRIQRDAAGAIVDEVVTVAGEAVRLHCDWSVDGSRQCVATSLGDIRLQYERDAMGFTRRLWLDSTSAIAFERSPMGAPLRVLLPNGGAIESEYDPLTRPISRHVFTARTKPRSEEPVYVGRRADGDVVKTLSWSLRGELSIVHDSSRGAVHYTYDTDGRLIGRRLEGVDQEAFNYDGASNVIDVSVSCSFNASNQLVQRGNAQYDYDGAGRRVRKHIPDADGGRTWTFEWNGQGLLAAVACPDGTRAEYSYDAFARRQTKRVQRTDGRSTVTRYVWDERHLFQERTIDYATDGKELSSELRVYAYEDRNWHSPIAERRIRREGERLHDDGWVFFCASVLGTPEEILGGDGSVRGTMRLSAYGQLLETSGITTRARFPGQWIDEESGLHYNLHRYYDPEVGQYISPDPWGIEGNLNVYAYPSSPTTHFDPYGLHGLYFGVFDKDGNSVGPGAGQPTGPGNWSPLQSGQNGAPFTADKYGQLGTGDTEAKAIDLLNDPKNAKAKKAIEDGGTAKMGGEYPPCKSCHRKLKKFMEGKNNKGKVEYHYPVNQKITYNGGGVKGKDPVETTKGSKAAALTNAYDNDKIVAVNPPKQIFNKDGSPKMKNGQPVIKTKESTASKEYQSQKGAAEGKADQKEWPDPATKAKHDQGNYS